MRLIPILAAGSFSISFCIQASALDQAKHRDISRSTCLSAGLDDDFCKRMGAAAYNVDWAEWKTLAAHAQPESGQKLCSAANATLAREASLGGEIRAALEMPPSTERAETLADAMGRALHTIQDNCAHKGVSNPHHAWYSLMDSCDGTKLSPDVQADSVNCAQFETEYAMFEFADALDSAGVTNDELSDVDSVSTHWPARGNVCEFLKGADDWNGQDVRWNNNVVTYALADAFVSSMTGSAYVSDMCQVPSSEFAYPSPHSLVDTSLGADWCFKLNVYCVGKADAPDELPPWADAEPAEPTPAASSSDSGGSCSMTSQAPTPNTAYWLAALGALSLARRSQKRRD